MQNSNVTNLRTIATGWLRESELEDKVYISSSHCQITTVLFISGCSYKLQQNFSLNQPENLCISEKFVATTSFSFLTLHRHTCNSLTSSFPGIIS